MSRVVVLIGENIGSANLARLRLAQPDLEFRLCLEPADFVANAAEAKIIFSKQFPPGYRRGEPLENVVDKDQGY